MKLWKLYKKFPYLEYRHRLVHNLPQNGRLLEVGCSTGDRARLFKTIRPDLEVIASDLKDFSSYLPDDIPFYPGDLTQRIEGLEDNSFDGITAMHLFEHLPINSYTAALNEIERLLKPGGVIYLESPGIRSIFFPSFGLGLNTMGCPLNFYDDWTHIAPFTRGRGHYLLKDHGFKNVRSGVVRNWLFAIASPALIIIGLLTRKRLLFAIGGHHLVGWSIFASGQKSHT